MQNRLKWFILAVLLLVFVPEWQFIAESAEPSGIFSSSGHNFGGRLGRGGIPGGRWFRPGMLDNPATQRLDDASNRGLDESGTAGEERSWEMGKDAAERERNVTTAEETSTDRPDIRRRMMHRTRERIRESRASMHDEIRERRVRGRMARRHRMRQARRGLQRMMMEVSPAFEDEVWKNPHQTVRELKERLTRARGTGDVKAERKALMGLGQANFLVGRFRRAVTIFNSEVDLARSSGDTEGEAAGLRNVGMAIAARGRYREALKACRESAAMFRERKNFRGQGLALNNIGLILKNSDNYRESLEAFNEALQVDKEPDETRVAKLMNLGELHVTYANYQAAEKVFIEALEIWRKTGTYEGEVETLVRLASVQNEQGGHEKALEYLMDALNLLKRFGQPTETAKRHVGEQLLDMGRLDEAEQYLKEGGFASSLGRYYLARKDYSKAREYYEILRKSAEEDNDDEELFSACTGLGLAAEAKEDWRGAERHFERGMKVVEEIRSTLIGPERRNFYAGKIGGVSRSACAKGLTRVRLRQGKHLESIYPSEVTRAREFSDNLSQRVDLTNFRVPAEVRQQEMEQRNVLSSLIKARDLIPRAQDKERYEELSREISQVQEGFRSFIRLLRKEHPDYAAIRYPQPVDLKGSRVRPGEYVVMLDVLGSGIGAKLLKGKKLAKATFIPMDNGELESKVRKFREPFERVVLADFDVNLAKELYTKILAPVISGVPEGTPVIIIPDAVLALVPFQALVTEGTVRWEEARWGQYPKGLTYVGDRHPVSYYQSLTALTLARTPARQGAGGDRLLVFADPVFQKQDPRARAASPVRIAKEKQQFAIALMDAIETEEGGEFKLQRLNETGELAEYLEKLYGDRSDVFTGLDATKGNLIDRIAPAIGRYRTVVFATHGLASNRIPGIAEPALALSTIPEGTDAFLTMSEVTGMDFKAHLAALTACQSGLGKILAGEGVLSMGRAFQAAGAKAVLMSLWSVSESASISLMEAFFKHVKEGKPKLQAWQDARRELRNNGFDHPFFWAPFILVGEVN